MTVKRRTKKDKQLHFMEELIDNNSKAIERGPKKKSWSLHDLRDIKPMTYAQNQMFESYFSGKHIVASGSAGTGKSYVAVYLALTDVLKQQSKQKEIIIVRSATSTKSVGFLPGSLEEKMMPFELPYKDIFANLLGKGESYDNMKEAGIVKFMATSYVRGLTWNNAIVIVDEIQSMTDHEINSIMTRIGHNTKIIACGDVAQNDLIYNRNETSGLSKALSAFEKMPDVDIVTFTRDDIVRSGFVRQWICALEDAS